MKTTKEECIQALRIAAEELGGSPSKAEYEGLGLRPASATIIRVMGGWNDAKREAGLEVYSSSGTRVQPKPDDVTVSVDTPWAELTVDQRWYYKNAEADNQYELERRADLREMIRTYKEESDGCPRCGELDPACLDFHHPNPEEKEMAVNKMVPYGYSREDIKVEMQKCDLLCANCHHREHHSPPTFATDGNGSGSTDTTPNPDVRRWIWEYKVRQGRCKLCAVADPMYLEFHHRDSEEKEMTIAESVNYRLSKQELYGEINKCDLICRNCHRKIHHA